MQKVKNKRFLQNNIHMNCHISVRFTFACPCKARTCNRYVESFFYALQATPIFGVFLGLGSNRKEVKPQGERLAGFPTLLASGDSRRCTWRLLTHCCSWLTITLLQTGGRNSTLGREGVPALGLSHLWTGTAAAAKSRGERWGWLLYALSE